MQQPMKQIIEILNSVPKTNLNYAIAIYDRYSDKFADWVFENSEDWQKVFVLPYIIKQALSNTGDEISDNYFDKLEDFFKSNYQQDFLLKTDLFLQVMAEKTKKYFEIKWWNEVVKAGKYGELFGLVGDFEIKTDKTKNEIVLDIVNLYLSEYLKKVLFIRVFVIYDILLILDKKDYSPDVTDDFIFNAINTDLQKTFLQES